MMELLEVNWTNTFSVVGFGFTMVLIILTLLVFLLIFFEKSVAALNVGKNKPEKKKEVKSAASAAADHLHKGYVTEEEMAAISMALHLYFDDVHDNESNVIKIKRVERRYSPWSSKIHGLNNFQK